MQVKLIKKTPNAPDPPGIRVQLWRNGAWRRNICGTVIGSYDGIVGVLLDCGTYIDVPADHLRRVRRRRKNEQEQGK